jgi:F-type H+-transporting ATPase subunit c
MIYFALLVAAAGFGLPIAVLGAALGQGRIGASAVEGIARQPEAAGRIQTAMIIALALVESLAIYALLVSLILLFVVGLPDTNAVLQAIQAGGGQ